MNSWKSQKPPGVAPARTPIFLVKIDDMLERIRRERGSGSDFLDLKTGAGGIIEGEFLVQALQMRENIWEPNWQRAVDRLRERGIFNNAEATKLKQLIWLPAPLRIRIASIREQSVSSLPSDPSEQREACYPSWLSTIFDTFRRDYIDAREAIHTIYERHVVCQKSRFRVSSSTGQCFNVSEAQPGMPLSISVFVGNFFTNISRR